MGTNGKAGRAFVVAQNLRRCRPVLIFGLMVILISSALFFASCKRNKAAAPASAGISSAISQSDDASKLEFVPTSPIESELYAKLLSEFERLGIDPVRAVAKEPAGNVNAVFDFTARLASEAGEQPASVVLTWTEQLTGDYDQNGEVGIPDITPIALSYLKRAQYETQILWTGAKRPMGDPEDDGGSASGDPPAAGSGAENWRLARIDGDFNGEIGISDVTPIALHYLERLDGHRVYRKRLGEAQFTRLTNPDSPSSPLTIPRAMAFPDGATTPDANRPVRYSFTDADAGEGIVIYFTTAYDIVTGQEGPPSNGIAINTATGEVDDALEAKLSVTPDYGPAPLVVTFDASGSVAQGGEIAVYKFDFDGDGKIDYSTADAEPPEITSAGKAIDITLTDNAAVVTARFIYGDSEYMNSSVRIVDESGLESNPAIAKLGVSYWEREPLGNIPLQGYSGQKPRFYVNPVDKQILAIIINVNYHIKNYRAISLLWRTAPGIWEEDSIIYSPNSLLDDYENTYAQADLFFSDTNQPNVLISLEHTDNVQMFTKRILLEARRNTLNNWVVSVLRPDNMAPDSEDVSTVTLSPPAFIDKNTFVYLLKDKGYYWKLLWRKDGKWLIEDTGYTRDNYSYITNLQASPSGELYAQIPPSDSDKHSVWLIRRNAPEDWSEIRIDNGEFRQGGAISDDASFVTFCFGEDGKMYFAKYRNSFLVEENYAKVHNTLMGIYDGSDFNVFIAHDFGKIEYEVPSWINYIPIKSMPNGAAIASWQYGEYEDRKAFPTAAAWFDQVIDRRIVSEYMFYEPKEVGIVTEAVVDNLTSMGEGNWCATVVYDHIAKYLLIRRDPANMDIE